MISYFTVKLKKKKVAPSVMVEAKDTPPKIIALLESAEQAVIGRERKISVYRAEKSTCQLVM